ncbi:hypothetical protein AAEU29_20470 [Pseudoalteromonas sp. SSM20]|uniref:hypothetical protein n=1 Tax=Pseudoalteromonas sp. SSM20 TaxID=3139394 RepID=UPI003BA9D8E9
MSKSISQETQDVLIERQDELEVPGSQVELDADIAEAAGAFEEDALTEDEALDSAIDVNNEQ